MPYNKTTWMHGDAITAEKLNKIEDGIESANQNSGSSEIEESPFIVLEWSHQNLVSPTWEYLDSFINDAITTKLFLIKKSDGYSGGIWRVISYDRDNNGLSELVLGSTTGSWFPDESNPVYGKVKAQGYYARITPSSNPLYYPDFFLSDVHGYVDVEPP